MPATTTHRYGDHPDQLAELTLPDGAAPDGPRLPVAVLLHGGFWMRSFGDLSRMRPLAADLAARGWAAWNVEYRRLGGDGGWPQSGADVSAAVDALAGVAQEVPLDLTRVVTIGHSAGGHLGLMDAVRDGAERAVRVAAVVGQAALTDLPVAYAHVEPEGRAIFEAFLGGTLDDRPQAYRAASPAHRLPLGIPLLIVHGEEDDRVPVAMADAYVAAAREAGDAVTYDRRPGEDHFAIVEPDGAAWTTVVDWLAGVV